MRPYFYIFTRELLILSSLKAVKNTSLPYNIRFRNSALVSQDGEFYPPKLEMFPSIINGFLVTMLKKLTSMALWPIAPMSAICSDRTIIIMKDDSDYVPGYGEPSTDDMKYPVLLMDVAQKIVKEEEKEGKGSLLTEKQKKKLSRYMQKLGFENIAATFYDSNAGSREQVVNFNLVVSLNL